MIILLICLSALVGFVIILLLLAPKKYSVNRSIVIDKSVAEVFEYVKHSKNQMNWSPWQRRDPDMKQTYQGEDGTVGFTTSWESDHKQVGHGEQEIASIVPNERIETALRFLKPFKSESMGYFNFHKEGLHKTKLEWGFYGKHKIPVNVMMLFFNMDKAVGKDFEEGLAELKKVLEN